MAFLSGHRSHSLATFVKRSRRNANKPWGEAAPLQKYGQVCFCLFKSCSLKRDEEKKKIQHSSVQLAAAESPLHLCFLQYIKTGRMSILIILPIWTRMQKNRQVAAAVPGRGQQMAVWVQTGEKRGEGKIRNKGEIHTFPLMHHSSKVDIHSILNAHIKSAQRQYCVWSVLQTIGKVQRIE